MKLALASTAMLPFGKQAWATAAEGGPWRTFRLTYTISLPADKPNARLWVPIPETSMPYQLAMGSTWSGSADDAFYYFSRDDHAPILFAEWKDSQSHELKVQCNVRTRDRQVDLANLKYHNQPLTRDVRRYLQPSAHIPIDGIVHKTAQMATKGAKNPLDKARAIYEWVVENTFRDPKTRGCGRGDIKFMLETGNTGGKCADISSLFVGLCRAAGIPAREKFGIRVADSAQFKSIGKSGDITKAQHCRTEFYLAGYGWFPVDPADIRKIVLEEKLPLNDPKVQAAREKFFGYWEMNWAELNCARDFNLAPKAVAGPVNYLMYPYGEVGGIARDGMDPADFVYKIESTEI